MGLAPDRHILMPLYCAGLCDAVNIAPGASRRPDGEVEQVGGREPDVDHVDALRDGTPSAKAAESSTPDGRMSRARTMRVAPSLAMANRANAAPMDRHIAASIWSG